MALKEKCIMIGLLITCLRSSFDHNFSSTTKKLNCNNKIIKAIFDSLHYHRRKFVEILK